MAQVKLHPAAYADKPEDVTLFDPSINSLNEGDAIIQHYCNTVLREIFSHHNTIHIPTHCIPDEKQLSALSHSATKIVCGTNLMTPHYEEFSNWKIPYNLASYRNIVTFGVGWGYYCDDISPASRFVYNTILSKDMLHSVRDSYTESKFREMGFANVVNTGCPTLWGLTPEACSAIPQGKSRNVITTLTDYARDEQLDIRMFQILHKHYENVYVWVQGADDMEYLRQLTDLSALKTIPRSFDAYTEALKMGDVDYVGTRLHAGIHAMNMGVRSIILAVDNRAIEMGRDFNMPVLQRKNLEDNLEKMILDSWHTSISLPSKQIQAWKNQFSAI